jgi:hypothetical protein
MPVNPEVERRNKQIANLLGKSTSLASRHYLSPHDLAVDLQQAASEIEDLGKLAVEEAEGFQNRLQVALSSALVTFYAHEALLFEPSVKITDTDDDVLASARRFDIIAKARDLTISLSVIHARDRPETVRERLDKEANHNG